MEPVLSSGQSGEWVTYLQECLAAAGFDPGGRDGSFGPATAGATRDFQASRGLVADGVVGPATWAALTGIGEAASTGTGAGTTTGGTDPGEELGLWTDWDDPAAAVPPQPQDKHPCRYEPGEKEWSATEPGYAAASTGVVPTPLDEANESARATLAAELGVDDEHLEERCREFGLPDPPPRYTPALNGTFVLSGFQQGSPNLKQAHFDFLADLVLRLRLNTDNPRYYVTRIEGFTDCVDSFSTNVGIRLARAEHTRAALINAGAREEYVGPAVATTAESISSETGPTGRAANRAALGVLDLVAVPRVEPPVDIPPNIQPTCQEPSDSWAFSTHLMAGGGWGFGAEYLHVYLINKRTGCRHGGHIAAVGLASPGAGVSVSEPGEVPLSLLEEAFSFQLSGFGDIVWVEVGVVGLGLFEGTLIMGTGPMAGIAIDLGGFQFTTGIKPGGDAGAMPCYLHVEEDGTPIAITPDA